ncbi:uncharacterized protein [Vicugna pacos]|uniref:Coiled-coil domain-containing protein 187 n=1 Tax=Vicugna pacos TaxID=30538 RepID=A0ABM5DI97_VICPA
MEQTATPGGRGLPCSLKQALALYQRIFHCPAGLGQLWAALQQVQEGQACPSGLELPTVLLQMERSRRAQEQLLWDLELLTGAGLGLFWPHRAQLCGLRGQAQCAWSQGSMPHGRMDGGSEQRTSWSSRLCSSPPAEDSLNQTHQLLEGGQSVDPSSAWDLSEARSNADPRWESPGMPAESTPGCLQELNPTTTGSFGEPGSSEFKDLTQRDERGQAEPTTQRPSRSSSRSLQEKKLAQGAPGPSSFPPQGLPEPQDPLEGLGCSPGQERAELQKLLRIEMIQSQREEDPQEQKEETPQDQRGEAPQGKDKDFPQRKREKTQQGQSVEATQALREEEAPEGQRWEAPQGENKEAPQGQDRNHSKCQRKEALLEQSEDSPQGLEVKILQSSDGRGCLSQALEVAQGEAPTLPSEEGGSLGILGDFCRSLGEQMPQPESWESPGPRGRTNQLMQVKTDAWTGESASAVGEQGPAREGTWVPLPTPRPPAQPPLPGPGVVMLAARHTGGSGQLEHLAAPSGHPGLVRDPYALQGPGGSPSPAEQEVGGSTGLPGALGESRGGAEAPKASKAAWPEPPGRKRSSAGVSAAQQETALQRLLELHREARRRRRQDREQQRLRVLERLRIARNRHCRVHPLGPPPNPAQLPPQARPPPRRRQWGRNDPARAGGGGRAGRDPGPLDVLAPRTCNDTCGEREGRAFPGAAPCWPHRTRALGGADAQRSVRPQEDAAGQRRALREQLERAHRERTGRLRALGARNTQNFQQLLWPPGAEEPGEYRSPFPDSSSHC